VELDAAQPTRRQGAKELRPEGFGAILLEQNDEWAVSRRYMSLETLAGLCDDPQVSTKAIPAD